MQRKVMGISVVAGVLALVAGGLCMAQPPQGGPGGPGGFGGFDPAQMRQRMMDNWKQQLGADDDAWKVIEPRLTKVMELNRQSMMGGRGMFGMMGMRGQRGQRGQQNQQGQQGQRPTRQQGDRPRFPGDENREPSAVEKAQETLETTLADESASADTIKTQLTALRAARVKAQQDLAAAQQDLRQILTLRQEAVLVLNGMLN